MDARGDMNDPSGDKVSDQADTVGPATNDPGRAALPPSKQTLSELTRTLKRWWQKDGPHARKWREGDIFNMGCKDAFDFVSMRQWTEDEVDYLKSQRRVPITFNRTLPTISAVRGIEINSRHEINYLPRTSDVLDARGHMVVKANEDLTAASQAFADECDAEDEESEAFGDALICGMGWSETRVDYDEDPTGQYGENTLDPNEMAWDYRARKKNLKDAQRLWHLRKMPLHEAQSLFPDVSMEDLDCGWAIQDVEPGKWKIDDAGQTIDQPISMGERDFDPQMEVHILRVQWWEHEPIMLVAHPANPGAPQVMTEEQYKTFSDVFSKAKAQAESVGQVFPPNYSVSAKKGRRKVYREAYIGREVLEDPKPPQYGAANAPTETEGGFTIHCVTGIPDKMNGYWFGLVAVMKDPQKWANAWLSQTQHILNSTAKGGIIAEQGAFVDPRKAEQDYGRPDSIVFVNDGAITKNQIMQKPGVGITAGHANLLQFAVNSIRDVSGFNVEALGMADRNQPGVLEAQRKQAAMTILAPWFDSLRRYRKQIGRVRLYYIQKYLMTPDRMIRIAGDDGMKLIPLMKANVMGKHDVVISDAPTSTNQKEATWALMQPLLPLLGDKIKESPELFIAILKYSPLPTKLADEFMRVLQKPPPPQVVMKTMLEAKGAQSQIALNQAKVDQTQADTASTAADTILKLAQTASEQASAKLASQVEAFGREISMFVQSLRGPQLTDQSPPPIPQQLGGPPGVGQLPQLPHLPMQGGPQGMPPGAGQPPQFIDGQVGP